MCKVEVWGSFGDHILQEFNTVSDQIQNYKIVTLVVTGQTKNYEGRGCQTDKHLHRNMQCGGSGMFIPDPGSWFLPILDPGSRIPDPGSKNGNKRRGEKKFVVITFYVATNFTKLKIILVLKCEEKN